jgi:hypothetical protein
MVDEFWIPVEANWPGKLARQIGQANQHLAVDWGVENRH